MEFWPNSTGMVAGWFLTEIVQMVLIGCISRSRGQKSGFQKAIFKNLLVWIYKAQGFHIWYTASSGGLLQKVSKISSCGQNWPRTGGHNFTLNYIRKTANDFFSWTSSGNFTKLDRNGCWVALYNNCSTGSDWLHKWVMGSTNRFLKCNFQKSSGLKLQGPELLYLVYRIIYRSSTKVVQSMSLG